MNRKKAFLFFTLVLYIVPISSQITEIISIDGSKKKAVVPSSMYGVFFEEINHGGEGGLYAELVKNRSFEEKELPVGYSVLNGKLVPPPVINHLTGNVVGGSYNWDASDYPGWSLKKSGEADATMFLTKNNPLHLNTPNSMQINIINASSGVSLVNSGYWGIGVYKNKEYKLRFFLKTALNYTGKVTARLISSKNKIIAEKVSSVKNNGSWTEYNLILSTSETDSASILSLLFDSAGTVWVDYVSLFPAETYKNRINGMRNDVAQFIDSLNPGFLRWPGGCIVEGITFSNRVKWKETLGDPMKRTGEYDTWGYRNNYGFGYHEFLQFCEDIGAKGMFVCNVGMGCQARTGDICTNEELPDVLNDALDAIEYAIGDITTKWGAVRSKAGHPKPFPLQYVEIGNENSGPVYDKNFDIFYAAIKKKYPMLTLISNHGLGDNNVIKTDMVDPHWYVAPDYFFQNDDIFDNVKRGKYEVYVGEYACNNTVGSGNFLAALSEAAFITGMERNSDLVKMASYAPLFQNKYDRAWAVNLILISTDQVVGRSSYYVQRMFVENKPTYNLETNAKTILKPGILKGNGYVGFGSWSTNVEFKEMKITTTDRVEQNIDISDPNWKPLKGTWVVEDKILKQNSLENLTKNILKSKKYENYTLEFKARKINGNEGFMIYFGMSDDNNGYLFNVAGWGNTGTAVQKLTEGGTGDALSVKINHALQNDVWYNVKVVVTETTAELIMDGVSVLKYIPKSEKLQYVISGYDEKKQEVILKVVNRNDASFSPRISLNNFLFANSEAKSITLTASSVLDENTFENPFKIMPIEDTFKVVSNEFNYSFKPNSFTVLRIPVKRIQSKK